MDYSILKDLRMSDQNIQYWIENKIEFSERELICMTLNSKYGFPIYNKICILNKIGGEAIEVAHKYDDIFREFITNDEFKYVYSVVSIDENYDEDETIICKSFDDAKKMMAEMISEYPEYTDYFIYKYPINSNIKYEDISNVDFVKYRCIEPGEPELIDIGVNAIHDLNFSYYDYIDKPFMPIDNAIVTNGKEYGISYTGNNDPSYKGHDYSDNTIYVDIYCPDVMSFGHSHENPFYLSIVDPEDNNVPGLVRGFYYLLNKKDINYSISYLLYCIENKDDSEI